MVGLPARGKTYIATKLAYYLNWIMIKCKGPACDSIAAHGADWFIVFVSVVFCLLALQSSTWAATAGRSLGLPRRRNSSTRATWKAAGSGCKVSIVHAPSATFCLIALPAGCQGAGADGGGRLRGVSS